MSDFEPTDSESDYEENEKILLENFRKKKYDSSDESEEEVLSVGAEEDDEDDDDDIEMAESDVEERENEGLPSEKAWGKKKKTFYSTDYVDPDYEGFNEKDMQLAEMEGEEAKKLQLRLAQQLDDDDFALDFLNDTTKIDNEIAEEIVKTDASKFSKEEKIQFLKKESPELFSLMEDFLNRTKIYKTFIQPVLTKYKNGKLPNSSAMDFIHTFSKLILNYCVNIYMFILLKASKESVNNHPVVKRLYQYRQLLKKLDAIFEETIKPHIKDILLDKESSEKIEVVETKKKKLKLLEKLQPVKPILKKKKEKVEAENKQVQFAEEPEQKEDEEVEMNDEPGKRGITYQIAKNKGLTPHRKKEQRNPRVKHRNKFRKAKIRRKGAVREVRNEIKRYGGEMSGIKATVTKSIKIKS